MEQAKNAVKGFMSKSGHHDTTVHETVAPAVTHETVQRKEHENVTTAVDQEIHQDHYHTSVQPIADKEVKAETHHHNIVPVEHRSYEHDNKEENERKLAAERAQFKDTTTHVSGEKTRSAGAAVSGEHVHHHVHETIQPVLNKQTIEPHVVHTTVPIHEVHHNAAQHHATSELPPVSMSEYKNQGGVLSGREERYDGFEGEPRSVSGAGHSSTTGHSTTGASSTGGYSSGTTGHSSSHTGAGVGATGATGAGVATGTGSHSSTTTGPGNSSTSSTTGQKQPSLMDKLNPKKDANHDGKAGFMS